MPRQGEDEQSYQIWVDLECSSLCSQVCDSTATAYGPLAFRTSYS